MRTYLNAVAVALVLAVGLRGCVVQAFKVPSASMLPTLQVGDHIFASPIGYGVPAPLVGGWMWWYGEPRPGDIVILERREDRDRRYVKRVIAVGGEIVEATGGIVSVDGHPRQAVPAWIDPPPVDDFGPVRVPSGHVFVLGDNRDQSIDSRDWGPVHSAGIKGRVFLIYWSQRKSGGGVRWERLGSLVQ